MDNKDQSIRLSCSWLNEDWNLYRESPNAVHCLKRVWQPLISISWCTSATLEIIWPSQYSSAGAETEIDLHMLRLERGWGCVFCGYQSASTAAKVDVRRHIRRQHFGLTGR